jgi:hypothetical protein
VSARARSMCDRGSRASGDSSEGQQREGAAGARLMKLASTPAAVRYEYHEPQATQGQGGAMRSHAASLARGVLQASQKGWNGPSVEPFSKLASR